MTWKPTDIVAELQKIHREGKSLSYRALGRLNRPLLSAAVYRFGSYRKAVEQAGIDYEQFMRRPRWNRQSIIDLVRSAQARGEDLNWAAVTARDDDLRRAAYAALQKRLFGSWASALEAAGVNAIDARSYRQWDNPAIVEALRRRRDEGQPMSSSAVQREDASLHAASLRHFGTYDAALRAADLDPTECRVRRRWSRTIVLDALRRFEGNSPDAVDDAHLRAHDSALHRAAMRLFGSIAAARAALKTSADANGDDRPGDAPRSANPDSRPDAPDAAAEPHGSTHRSAKH